MTLLEFFLIVIPVTSVVWFTVALSCFSHHISHRMDFTTEVGGVRYLCKSDGSCVAEAVFDNVRLVFRDFVEVGKKAYVLKEIRAVRNSRIQTVIIPKNVEKIDEKCFYECKSLCEVAFESDCQLKEIGKLAFSDSGVKRIEIPPKCETLAGPSLYGVSTVTISEGNKCFIMKGGLLVDAQRKMLIRFFGLVSNVLIDRSIESISENCFYECKSLCETEFESDCQLKEIGKSAL
jgi:hypothetical protein